MSFDTQTSTLPTWEDTEPAAGLPAWEETVEGEDGIMPRVDFQRIKDSFTGDPLSFLGDGTYRRSFDAAVGRLPDADMERRKWALAAYFSHMRQADINTAYDNLDTLISDYYGDGTRRSSDEAFRDIAMAFRGERKTTLTEKIMSNPLVAALVAGEGEVSKAPFNVGAFLAGAFAEASMWRVQGELAARNPEALNEIKPQEVRDSVADSVRGVWKKGWQPAAEWGEENMDLPPDWFTSSEGIGDWIGNATVAVVNYIPQLAAQTGLMALTGGTSALGAVYGVNAYYDIKDEHPEMTEAQAMTYGIGVGLINSYLEKITLGIAEGRISRELAKKGISKGLKAAGVRLGTAGGLEGGQEGLEQFSENVLDIAMGLRGDRSKWQGADWRRELWRGIPESAFLGTVTGVGLEAGNLGTYRDVANRNLAIRESISQRTAELEAKEDLTPEEQSQLETLQTVNDSSDDGQVAEVGRQLLEDEIAARMDEVIAEEQMTPDELETKRASEAERDYRIRHAVPHALQDVTAAVEDYARTIRNGSFTVVENEAGYPLPVLSEMKKRGYDGTSRAIPRAFHFDGMVYLDASRVTPSEVAKVLTHEVVGHEGIRQVIPAGEFDRFLDNVYELRHSDDLFRDTVKTYFPELEKKGLERGETAEETDLELSTAEDRRYASEEYLARLSETSAKPSWWQSLINDMRNFLRKIFPRLAFGARDIERALARSAKVTRRSRLDTLTGRNESSVVVETEPNPEDATGFSGGSDLDVRFSLADYSDADRHDIVYILKPLVGVSLDARKPEDFAAVLAERGVSIPPADAMLFALDAIRAKGEDLRRASQMKRNRWLTENVDEYRWASEYAGSDSFVLKPSAAYEGQEFTGTMISPDYRKYSLKRRQRRNESDKAYAKYLAERERRLRDAEGIATDELAESVARKTGLDAQEVEARIIEFYRNLKKPELYGQYTEWRNEGIAADKATEREMREEFLRQERYRVENQVVEILRDGRPVDPRWLADKENRDVVRELQRVLMADRKPKTNLSEAETEALNIAIMSRSKDADAILEAYRSARDSAYQAFVQRLGNLRQKVMRDNRDGTKIQRDALDFAEKNLPKENRADFARRILELADLPAVPSPSHPEGRRQEAFQALIREMTEAGGRASRDRMLAELRGELDAARIRRTPSGKPVSVMESVQADVDEIRRIVSWRDPQSVDAYRGQQLQVMSATEEGSPEWLAAKHKADLADEFGTLAIRPAKDTETALGDLQDMIHRGKRLTKERMEKRMGQLKAWRTQAVADLTNGVVDTTAPDAKRFNEWWIHQNPYLDSLLKMTSMKSDEAFAKSFQAGFVRRYDEAQERMKTQRRKLDDAVQDAVRNIFGDRFKGEFGGRYRQFLAELNREEEETGATRKVYTARVRVDEGAMSFIGRHPAYREQVNWRLAQAALADIRGDREQTENPVRIMRFRDRGVVRRSLQSYGEVGRSFVVFETGSSATVYTLLPGLGGSDRMRVHSFKVPVQAIPGGYSKLVPDSAVRFAQRQIADADAGVRPLAKDEFGNEAEDEAFQALGEKERDQAHIDILTEIPDLEVKTEKIRNMTRGQALQIILEYEQADFRDALEWNGFTAETILQLKDFVGDDYLRFGYWMRDYIKQDSERLDRMSHERYGVHLPGIENYWPGMFKGQAGQKMPELDNPNLGTLSLSPSFLIARRGHLKAPDTDVSALDVFLRHSLNQAHYLELNDIVADLRGVYSNKQVLQAINTTLGKVVADDLLRRIGDLARGGGDVNSKMSKLGYQAFRHWIPSRMILNFAGGMKQMAGMVTYMDVMPMGEFARRVASEPVSDDFRVFLRQWLKRPEVKNRLKGGMSAELMQAMNKTLTPGPAGLIPQLLKEYGSLFLTGGDAFSTIVGGYAVWSYTRDQALKTGKPKAEAEEDAWYAWLKATNKTQQSANVTDKNYYQLNTAWPVMTMFMSNPIQTLGLVQQSLDEMKLKDHQIWKLKNLKRWREWKDWPELRTLGRRLFVSHVLVPGMMFAITQVWRNGLDLEDWDWEELLYGMVAGSWEGLFLFPMFEGFLKRMATFATDGRYFSGGESMFPAQEGLEGVAKIVQKSFSERPLTRDDLWNGLRDLSDSMMGIALFTSPGTGATVGAWASIMSALGIRGRQWDRLITDDRKRK